MKAQKNIVVIGIGSIGARHVSNLLSMGYDRITLITRRKEFPSHWPKLSVYSEFQNLPDSSAFTHALICSPTARHLEDLIPVLQAGISSIFLEKPLSHSLDGLDQIESLIQPHQKIVMGFDLRFDPGLNKVKEILSDGRIGRVLSANAFVGQYLPDWRPYEDYRLGMSASISKGGGVMLDLIHEFDYLCWLFGKPEKVCGMYQMNPELEIETEDLADVLVRFQKGINVSIHLDYHQRNLVRNCLITGEKGSILWDLANRKVSLTNDKKEVEIFDFNSFERNDRYLEILDVFLNNPKDPRLCTYPKALESLELVVAAKTSSQTNSIIQLPVSI